MESARAETEPGEEDAGSQAFRVYSRSRLEVALTLWVDLTDGKVNLAFFGPLGN